MNKRYYIAYGSNFNIYQMRYPLSECKDYRHSCHAELRTAF